MSTYQEYIIQGDFPLESGHILQNITIRYHQFGKAKPDGSNVIWICHALTANSNPLEWWPGLVGKNKLFDPEHWCIICANILGSCYGSTGPLHLNPITEKPYLLDFPAITTRDMAAAHNALRQYLGISSIFLVIGGSLGGHQALEWAVSQPQLIQNLIIMASNAQHSPWGIAWNAAQRMALEQDPTFRAAQDSNGGAAGLATARAIAMISYRHYDSFHLTQQDESRGLGPYRPESYLHHQGNKLVQRFNAYSYYTLSRAMDSHDIGRGRGGIAQALALIQARTLIIGISSDILFPTAEQKLLAASIQNAEYRQIPSLFGHDGFLIEYHSLEYILKEFLHHDLQSVISIKGIK
jgi:homoserine O-acetyltransferase